MFIILFFQLFCFIHGIKVLIYHRYNNAYNREMQTEENSFFHGTLIIVI